MSFLTKIKHGLQQVIWPSGTVATIQRGHLQGLKFVITDNLGWSPILGRWEPESHEVFARFIKPGQTVFDLGANNGIHSLLFSKLVGKSGKVIAFEPLPENVEELRKNFGLNNITNIEVVQSAVGDHDGEITFFLGQATTQGSIVGIGRQSGSEKKVPLICLNTFITNKRLKPDFIKMDIEGAESAALEGLGDLINEIKPVFFIELHTPEQDQKVGSFFRRYNYQIYRVTQKKVNRARGLPYLEEIKDLHLTYPHPDGIWGTILALPPSFQLP
ncbi:MAG: FkbM family methyltransferase [Chitinophagaceae bacterium]